MTQFLSQAARKWCEAMAEAGFTCGPSPTYFHWGHLVNPAGDRRAAERAYRTFVQEEPRSLVALEGLAFLLQTEGRYPKAAEFRRRIVELEVDRLAIPPESREEAIAFLCAKAGLEPSPTGPPPAYFAALFDRYADTFDQDLTEKLRYCGPRLLDEAVRRSLGEKAGNLDILDAGCGTGLAGLLFRPLARRLDGLDLSPGMIQKATERGVYDRLDVGELCGALAERHGSYDLIVAADMLPYFGALDSLFSAVAGGLRQGGLFALTAERGEEPGYQLQQSGRYTHHLDYLRSQASAAGLVQRGVEEAVLRHENGQPVVAHVVVLARPARAASSTDRPERAGSAGSNKSSPRVQPPP